MKIKEYKVIIERDEDGLYVADVPSLPGCHTQAKDLETLNKRLKEAIILCEEELKSSKEYKIIVKNLSYNPTFIALQNFAI